MKRDRERFRRLTAGLEPLEERRLLAVTWSVTLNDPGGTYAAYYAPIQSTVLPAANEWGRFFPASNASIQLGIDFTTSPATPRGGGASETTVFVKQNGALNVFEQSISNEIRTGNDPNGSTRDGHIILNADYLANNLWFDPTPLNRTDESVPFNRTDAYSVMVHELGHALGFIGWRDWTSGALPGNYQSTFDQYVTLDPSGTPYFNGPAAKAAYGNQPVPLTYANIYHFGNNSGSGRPGADLLGDLMNGVVFNYGTRYYISPLDLAVLQDQGLPVVPNPGNHSPTLNNAGAPLLSAIGEDPVSNPGTPVLAMLATGAGGNPINDADPGALAGIAVSAVDNTNGDWQFSANAGATWTSFGSPANAAARLLAADPSTLIRFVPRADFHGLVSAGITFRAWDQTIGTAGGVANAGTGGGTSAFSTNSETASIVVAAVADTPQITGAATLEDTQTSSGLVVTRNPADGPEVTHFKIMGIQGGSLYQHDGTTAIASGAFLTAAQAGAGLKFTPAQNSALPGTVVVRAATGVADSALGGSHATATIAVTPVNDPPTIPDFVNRSLAEDTPLEIPFNIADVETLPGLLATSVAADHAGLFPPGSLSIIGGGGGRTLRISPAANQTGTSVVRVTVSDGSLETTKTFTLSVSPVNDPPTLSAIANQNFLEDGIASVELTIGDVETPAVELVVAAASDNGDLLPASGLVLSGSGSGRTLKLVPPANANGSAAVTVTVSDGALAASVTFTLNVQPVNDPPALVALPDKIVLKNGTAQIPLSLSDVETPAEQLTLNATAASATLFPAAGLSFDRSGAAPALLLTPAADLEGITTITVVVGDGDLTASRSFQVLVTTNPSPWHNPRLSLDVNDDQTVSPLDALIIINALNSTGPAPLPIPATGIGPPPYYDVFPDNTLTPLDALLVFNHLNSRPLGAEGEPGDAADEKVRSGVALLIRQSPNDERPSMLDAIALDGLLTSEPLGGLAILARRRAGLSFPTKILGK